MEEKVKGGSKTSGDGIWRGGRKGREGEGGNGEQGQEGEKVGGKLEQGRRLAKAGPASIIPKSLTAPHMAHHDPIL